MLILKVPICHLTLECSESHFITIFSGNTVTVRISAENVFGVRHGIETLTQLIASYPVYAEGQRGFTRSLVMVARASIHDKPVYRHRGLLIDTARNYLSIAAIKRQIDGMAASKLNVLHWHVTDSQSFPLESTRVPQMAKYLFVLILFITKDSFM